jgi:hypothetical protein
MARHVAEWRNGRMTLEVTMDAIFTLRHAKPPRQSFGRATANGMSDQTRRLRHPARLPAIGFDHLTGLIGKGPTIA